MNLLRVGRNAEMSLKFSVVIPAYNCEMVIVDALNSVCNQTENQYIGEIIVVNDGSSDHTLQKVKEYKNQSNILIKIINQKNSGVSKSRNVGVENAKYDWIAFLDSDDEWYKDKIERQVQLIQDIGETNIDALGGSIDGDELRILTKKYKGTFKATINQICMKNFPQPSTAIVKRKVFRSIGGFDMDQNYAEDGKFFLAVCYQFNLYYNTKQVVKFGHGKRGFGAGGLSGNIKEMHQGNMKNIAELYAQGIINIWFYYFLRLFYLAKYLRRILLSKLYKYI